MSSEGQYRAIPQTIGGTEADQDELDEHIVSKLDSRITWLHFVFGAAVLLPWNAMITATPYFVSRLSGSNLQSTFGSYMSTTFTAANFGVLAYATITSSLFAASRRAIISLSVLTVLVASLTLSTYLYPPPNLFFGFVIISGMIQASAASYLQASVFAIASVFGPSAIQAVMSGQAAVAVVVSGVQVISAAASVWGLPPELIATYTSDGAAEERSAFIFFSLSTLFLVFAAWCQTWMLKLPVYKSVMADQIYVAVNAEEQSALVSQAPDDSPEEKGRIWRIFKVNLTYEVAVAYVFIITLSVFPAITTAVLPTNPNTHPLLFSAVHFLAINSGDFFGRYICAYPRVHIWSAKRLLSLSLARTLFIPIFLMCNVQGSSNPEHSPIISSDILFMIIMVIFGATNGYLSSMCMMAAPSIEHNPQLRGRKDDAPTAATLASFCLVGGLAVGSVMSFAVRYAICGCNPFVG